MSEAGTIAETMETPETPVRRGAAVEAADRTLGEELRRATLWEDTQRAARETSSPEELRELARHASLSVRMEVGANTSTPPDVLEALSQDSGWEVRAAVFENPNCPEWLLEAGTCEMGVLRRVAVRVIQENHPQNPRLVLAARLGEHHYKNPDALREALDSIVGESNERPDDCRYAYWPQTARWAWTQEQAR